MSFNVFDVYPVHSACHPSYFLEVGTARNPHWPTCGAKLQDLTRPTRSDVTIQHAVSWTVNFAGSEAPRLRQ